MSEPFRDIPAFTLEQVGRTIDGSLSRAWDGAVDPPYVNSIEQFEGFTHDEIYRKVQAMEPRTLADMADRWRQSGVGLAELFDDLGAALRIAMAGWEGQSRDAAENASRGFNASGSEFASAVRYVAPRLEEISHVASSLRSSIQPPADNPIPGAMPGTPGSVVAEAEAANEARNQAVETMNAVYKPTFRPGGVGDGVPAFVAPVDPAPGFGDPGVTSTNSGGTFASGTSGTTTSSAGTSVDRAGTNATNVASPDTSAPSDPVVDSALNETPGTDAPATTQPVLAQQNPTLTETSTDTVRPTGITPSTAVPSSQLGSDTSRFTSDSPGYRSSTPNVSTPLVAQSPTQSPVVGPAPGTTNPAVAQANARQLGTRGMGGPGMFPGAGAARRSDDETEHKIPDYLITEENANALVGNLPKTAPPVLGVWDEKS